MKSYFNAITVYRFSSWLYKNKLHRASKIIDAITYFLFNCSIPGSCSIGQGTYCSHRGMSVVLHPNAIIGKDCIIGTCVTIGGKGKDIDGSPIIGDGVYISTGAKILGSVNIGNNSVIGANSVVLYDVQENNTIVGIPAKVIKSND